MHSVLLQPDLLALDCKSLTSKVKDPVFEEDSLPELNITLVILPWISNRVEVNMIVIEASDVSYALDSSKAPLFQ